MKKILAVILIAAILIALFLLAKHDKESQITQNQQTASTSVSAQVQEELPPSIEQQEVLKDASATIKPDEGAYVQLTEKTNIVEYKLKDNTEWKSAELNQKFTVGDTLRTGSESEGLLIFADGSSVKLSSLSQVTIDPVQKEINLSIGKIFVSFFKGSASPKVVTPNAVAAALGTMWVHELKEDGTSEVNVLEGQVNFTSGGESQVVNEGTFTKALHKKPPLKSQQFNVDNYAKSEKILRKVNVKKLADLHKKHDVEFYKKLKDNPEFQKKYEEKVKQLKIEQIEKKKVIENKLQDKKADIQDKIKENKLQQSEEKKIKAEDLKKKILENKKEQVIENKLNSDKKLQIQENVRDNKLQQNQEKKIKAEDLKKKIIEEKKEQPFGNKLDSDKKLQIQEKVKEEKLLKDQDNKKILEDKKTNDADNKKLLQEKKLQTEDNKKILSDEKKEKVQEFKKKIEEKKIQNIENKKPQIQQDDKKKVMDDKKNQVQQNPENKKKVLGEKKINEKKLLINR